MTLQSGQNVGQIIDNGIGSRLIEVDALVRTQRQDAGTGALAGLDTQRRILDNQALGRLHPQCLHGTQVDLGVGLKRTALVTADGVVQHVGDTGNLHQIKVSDIPAGKLRDKGTPAENISKFDGTKEEIVYLTCTADIKGKNLIFATRMGMVKQVPSEEFETNNRLVASTKLQENDKIAAIVPVEGQTDVVLQTSSGVFLRFLAEEISVMKKNSRGVRGIKLAGGEELEQIYLIGENPIITYKKKEVHLNRLKLGKRDGKGSKVRL